jgi:YidC/Oxa1 family membrane protein insertase
MFELIDFLIVNPIVNILFVIYNFIGDFGLAIILFTFIVKLITWPLMKKQLHQTKLMKQIQPELTEIRKRCNGNKQMESLQMMDLYKRKGVKPMASFWNLLIQLPIFIGMFTAIRVMAMPTQKDYVEKRAYAPIASMERIDTVITDTPVRVQTP